MTLKKNDHKRFLMKCIVCSEQLNPEEFLKLAEEFKPFPAHKECFDEFEDAETFLAYAKSATESGKKY